MISSGLTKLRDAARQHDMQSNGQGAGRFSRRGWGAVPIIAMLVAASMLSGCISVTAPDKPIVIELNINIKQEVIYRLAEDARQNIDKNPEIF